MGLTILEWFEDGDHGNPMPELPEVETVRRGLEACIGGAGILRVEILRADLRTPVDADALRRMEGASFVSFRRRGKYLVGDVSSGLSLIVHLGMSGRLLLRPSGEELHKHDHVRWILDNGLELRFRDPRRFGSVLVAPTASVLQSPPLAGLGIEPLDSAFTPAVLSRLLASSRQTMKSFLLDQTRVAGIGNIYANEILYRAGLHPSQRASELSERQIERLHESIVNTLREAIEQGGTTIRDYQDPNGQLGWFSLRLAVYHREGEPCPRCGAPIERLRSAGRSTFFCPNCQTLCPPQGEEHPAGDPTFPHRR
ncbi:MAG: bifunctional DNA-formamidopyrimidine glycosylase/DNA-(apurinic or apyrimidinic site) lyase [candidate division KSB1 bacterium]|nr:bifunctional DNA-formamidopyrimidine glycosylase/DNA-(apurinic or apyrimidinic site) lyase [candidate division KSB1 bacterium]